MNSSLKREIPERDPTLEKWIQDGFKALTHEVRKVVVGEDKLLETIFIALASEGSVIAESPPGRGKSLTTKTLATALDLTIGRIEFNPELMPQDVLGYKDPRTGEIHKGKIFNNLILAEEINRASGKMKSAFLGPMQEHSVELADVEESLALPRPSYTLGTMNPFEKNRDVYNLTTAELDRFSLRYRMKKKNVEELARIAVLDVPKKLRSVQKVMNASDLMKVIDYVHAVSSVSFKHPIVNYIARLAEQMQFVTQKGEDESEASERALRSFWLSLNAYRVVKGLDYIGPEHVRYLLNRCWQHRIIADSEKRQFEIIDTVLDERVPPVPYPAKGGEHAKHA